MDAGAYAKVHCIRTNIICNHLKQYAPPGGASAARSKENTMTRHRLTHAALAVASIAAGSLLSGLPCAAHAALQHHAVSLSAHDRHSAREAAQAGMEEVAAGR